MRRASSMRRANALFQLWTDPAHVGKWWGPRGFTTTTHAMDVRPGGEWRFIMHGPDGTDYKNRIVYLEVVPPERLVYKHAGEEETEAIKFHVTVTFAAEGGEDAADHADGLRHARGARSRGGEVRRGGGPAPDAGSA